MDVNTQLRYAEKILSELLRVGSSDLYEIYQMEEHHPGTIDMTFELFDEFRGEKPNFGFFVEAVKYKSLEEVRDVVTSDDYESFRDMAIDDDYAAWGPIASYGDYEGEDIEENHERQELFDEYVMGEITKDEFAKRYAELLPQEEVSENGFV